MDDHFIEEEVRNYFEMIFCSKITVKYVYHAKTRITNHKHIHITCVSVFSIIAYHIYQINRKIKSDKYLRHN